jgi:hypothetical protein
MAAAPAQAIGEAPVGKSHDPEDEERDSNNQRE